MLIDITMVINMLKKASAMTIRQNLGEILNEVQYRNDTVLITRADKPVAAIINIELFEKIRQMRKQFDILSAELAASCKTSDQKQVEKEIEQAIKEIREK